MTNRTLTIALVASVALNFFMVAAGATVLISRDKVEDRVAEQRRPGGRVPFMALTEGLAPEVRDRVRESMRVSALAARPDFEEARSARRAAMEAAGGETFDPAAVTAMLERSRQAEARGRARLERDTVALLATLDPEDRATLAPTLGKHGGRDRRGGREGQRGDDRRNDAPPPPPAD